VSPLALAFMILLAGVAGSTDRPDVASIPVPTRKAVVEEYLVLADDDHSTAGNRCYFLVETCCPANGYEQIR